jgi:hypothetical protein
MDPSFNWFSYRKLFVNEEGSARRVLFETGAAEDLKNVHGLSPEESLSVVGKKFDEVKEHYPDVRVASIPENAWNDAIEKTYLCENISDQFRSLARSLPLDFQISPFLIWMQDRWLKTLPLQVQVILDLREGDEIHFQGVIHFDRNRLTFFQEGLEAGIDDGVRRREIRITGRASAFMNIQAAPDTSMAKKLFRKALKDGTLHLDVSPLWIRLAIRYFI